MMEEILQAIKQTKIEIGNNELVCEWKEFLLEEIFNIQHGNGFDKFKLKQDKPKINFISRSREQNGVNGKVNLIENIEPFKGGLLTLSLLGYISCFLQKNHFIQHKIY